jgi:hypothetical protein
MMNRVIEDYLTELNVGDLQAFKGMSVLPVFRNGYEPIVHLTLNEAIAQGNLVITELSHAGSVPELKAINKGAIAVLVLDGEELSGAKQNRVLNTTILVKENSEIVIPVSCTEQGRWTHQSEHFSDSGVMMASHLRSAKNRSVSDSLHSQRGYRSDQGMVWEGIEELHRTGQTHSSTGAMRDAYEQKSSELEEYLEAFPCLKAQCGMLVFVRGSIAGLDVIPCLTAYRSLHRKLLTSYAMEAQMPGRGDDKQQTPRQGEKFLRKIPSCSESHFPSAGEGDDYRYIADGLVGSGLVAKEKLVHLAFFPTKSERTPEHISAVSRRRSYRQQQH